MNSYNIHSIKIDNLSQIIKNKKIHYVFKKVDFLYKPTQNSKKLAVVFHGSRSMKQKLPIFRSYNWDSNFSILSFSDLLLKEYCKDSLLLGWYLDTKKHKQSNIIIQVIKKIKKIGEYNKIIFFGSSGGGYPALKFASYFNEIAFFMNSQIYLNNHKHFDILKKILNENSDELLDFDIEKYIKDNGLPKKVILYCNIRDKHHYEIHSLPLEKFFNNNFLGIFKGIYFNGHTPPKGSTHHHVQLPNGMTSISIIDKL